MQAEEVGAGLDLGERAGEVHVAEDLVRLGRLVAAAEEHGVGALADELDPGQVGHDRRHHERVDAPAAELLRGGDRRRLQLVVLELEPHLAQLVGERGPRAGRVVGDEAQPMADGAKARDRLDRARDRLAGDMEDAVDVQQNGGHGARSLSG